MLPSILGVRKNPSKHSIICFALMIICSVLVACQPSPQGITVRPVSQRSLETPEGSYGTIAWLPNNSIVLEFRPTGLKGPNTKLWIMQSDGSEFHELVLPPDPQHECSFTEYHDPVVLQENQIAYVRSCSLRQGREPYWSSSLVSLDSRTKTNRELFNYQVPEAAAFSISFAPDLIHGIGATYSDIEHYLFGIDARGTYTLETGLLRPNRASWSVDGKTIAFFGNRSMRGESGPFWATQPYDLWVMPAECVNRNFDCTNRVELIVESVAGPTNLAWSPDGKWLAFDGSVQKHGKGIYLVNSNRQQVFQIASGNYERPTWSPDGQSLLVAVGSPVQGQPDPALVTYTSLALLNVSEIVKAP